ncbi:hypothetical protein [Anaeromyxobacter oryzae]|uniref:PRC-barrel domain-containing protein n=1 Tax=Anaeromyxobacter oryzae TaxID=2918170 RepID=A0ABN6MP84_9BACT|nr:hypothetical protein [Anaeromyxobacter oryzae]BDG02780.1 hypothetical protein AMOR_17760 [Anaeromyxobacter oryzae]
MADRERNGVQLGQRVRDLDGKDLGRVTSLYGWGFEVAKGFMMFRRDQVIRYDEVRGVRDGAVVVARSDRALFELAAGEMPGIWRIRVPPDFPAAATPPEARGVFEELAAERLQGTAPGSPQPAGEPPAITTGEVRDYTERRGETFPAPPAHP